MDVVIHMEDDSLTKKIDKLFTNYNNYFILIKK